MGEVYKVLDRELRGEPLALKLLKAELHSGTEGFERFRNEVLIARTLIHPAIVRIHDLGKTEEGHYFLTMEFVEGQTLQTLLADLQSASGKNSARLPFGQALRIFAQLVDGVAFAHRCSVVHRDLKPSNVLLLPNNQIKLLDFGVSKRLDDEQDLTKTGQILGTPLYMAPEQIRGESVDQRCDVYSLGLIGYELVTGRSPLSAATSIEALFKQLNDPLPPIAESGALVPQWYADVITRASAKDPNARFSHAGQMTDTIQDCIAKVSPESRAKKRIDVHAEASASSATSTTGRLRVVLIVAVLAVLSFALYQHRTEQQRLRQGALSVQNNSTGITLESSRTLGIGAQQNRESSATGSDQEAGPIGFGTPSVSAIVVPPVTPAPQQAPSPSPEPAPTPVASAASSWGGATPTPAEATSPTETPAQAETPIPAQTAVPAASPQATPLAPQSIVAELALRETSDPSPSTEFETAKITALRWVATVSGQAVDVLNAPGMAQQLKLKRVELAKPEASVQMDAMLLAVEVEQSKIRVGGSLGKKIAGRYDPGAYRLELEFRGQKLAELNYTIK